MFLRRDTTNQELSFSQLVLPKLNHRNCDMKSSWLLVALVLLCSPAAKLFAVIPTRPNILYFYVDDMGWGSIGPNGQAARREKGLPNVRTPNLDQLARQGVNFTRGYGCHVCSPARSSQQSGFHQGHTFADRNDPDNAKKAMRADDVLIGDALSSAGYVTGYWGKWGYGGSKDQIDPVIVNVQTLPTSHGYHHVLAELHHVRAHTFFQPTLWATTASADASGRLQLRPNSLAQYQGGNYPSTPAFQGHVDYPSTAYCDDSYAFAALDFIRAQGQKYNDTGQPFFGLLAVQIPHAPFGEISTLPNWDVAYADDPHFASLSEQSQQWAAMVTRIDAHFGNLLAALEDPNNDGDTTDSISKNTLVIFQSDNGGPRGKNNVELDANGGLRGNKGSIQEGGIRVPLVMRWPAQITPESKLRAGGDSEMVVDVTDLLPTFCDLAGIATPLGVDGVSIAPTLTGTGHQHQREFIIHEAGNGQSIIRNNLKLIRSKGAALTLFDLDNDPREENDLSSMHPKIVDELESLLIGERVTEPKGFANTYHRWIGGDGSKASDAANWSDYVYANAGITYMTDDGAPRLSWIAKLENTQDESAVAVADSDLEFLGLEIRGNRRKMAQQTLALGPDINLTGRNEIRLEAFSRLQVEGGEIESQRRVDIKPGANLAGYGTVRAEIHNHGTIEVSAKPGDTLTCTSDYYQEGFGKLNVELLGEKPVVTIEGAAHLNGSLGVTIADGFEVRSGATYAVIHAAEIIGTFNNFNREVVASDGTRFKIDYTPTMITLTAN